MRISSRSTRNTLTSKPVVHRATNRDIHRNLCACNPTTSTGSRQQRRRSASRSLSSDSVPRSSCHGRIASTSQPTVNKSSRKQSNKVKEKPVYVRSSDSESEDPSRRSRKADGRYHRRYHHHRSKSDRSTERNDECRSKPAMTTQQMKPGRFDSSGSLDTFLNSSLVIIFSRHWATASWS